MPKDGEIFPTESGKVFCIILFNSSGHLVLTYKNPVILTARLSRKQRILALSYSLKCDSEIVEPLSYFLLEIIEKSRVFLEKEGFFTDYRI